MSSITIRNLPEGVKESLARRAKSAGESLEAFLRRLLQSEASKVGPDQEWREFFAKWMSEPLPSLKPGEKDFWEFIEENRAKGGSITET